MVEMPNTSEEFMDKPIDFWGKSAIIAIPYKDLIKA